MAEALLLGIDIGTSSTKATLAMPGGDVVATASRPHGVSMPRPGWFEHDAEAVWWRDVVELTRELAPPTLAGVCVSGLGPCVLPADERGRPLRPAILYGIDTRAAREIEELNERFGEDRILRRAGSALSSQAVGPKLLWLQKHERELWAQTRRLFMASSFAVARLTGEYVLDHHSASQCDPLYDLDAQGWAEDWCESVAPDLELPPLVWPGDVVGRVSADAARETGLAAGTPVCAGTIDAWAEAHSVGVRSPGDFMLMYGTTIFMLEYVADAAADARLWSTAGCLPGTRTLAAGLATSGALTSWLRDIAGGVEYADLLAEAAAVPAGADGIVVLPYFAGERSPIYDPDARGVIAGLTLRHGRGHLYRALLEATAYAVRHTLEVFEEARPGARRIVPVGGGAAGRLWLQIMSDVTGHAQSVPAVTLGAAYGDALLAAQGVGLAAPDATWARTSHVIEPDPGAAALHDERYEIYRELHTVTKQLQNRLARATDHVV